MPPGHDLLQDWGVLWEPRPLQPCREEDEQEDKKKKVEEEEISRVFLAM